MSHQYMGTWRIIAMEQWDQDYIDLVVPGYFSFREDNLVVNHRDFDRCKPLAFKRLAYAPSQATVPHQRPTDRVV